MESCFRFCRFPTIQGEGSKVHKRQNNAKKNGRRNSQKLPSVSLFFLHRGPLLNEKHLLQGGKINFDFKARRNLHFYQIFVVHEQKGKMS